MYFFNVKRVKVNGIIINIVTIDEAQSMKMGLCPHCNKEHLIPDPEDTTDYCKDVDDDFDEQQN